VPLESLADLTATRYPLRIGVDRKGTTDNWIFTEMLAYYGISARHIEAWGGSVREVGYAEQTRLLTDGHIDAVFQNSQVPSSSLIEASYRRALRFLALPPDLVAHMTDLGWVAQEIPRGGYERVGGAGAIVSVGYMMPFIVNAEMSEDVVYAIVRALCTHPEETRSVHRSWRQFDPRTAWKDTGGELHPGAVRFFREEGYLNQ
jgi:hypothetical protein